MSNKTYDILVYITQIVLPAISVLILALAEIWGLPYGEAISGTVMALDAFLGSLLKYNSIKYQERAKGDEVNGL